MLFSGEYVGRGVPPARPALFPGNYFFNKTVRFIKIKNKFIKHLFQLIPVHMYECFLDNVLCALEVAGHYDHNGKQLMQYIILFFPKQIKRFRAQRWEVVSAHFLGEIFGRIISKNLLATMGLSKQQTNNYSKRDLHSRCVLWTRDLVLVQCRGRVDPVSVLCPLLFSCMIMCLGTLTVLCPHVAHPSLLFSSMIMCLGTLIVSWCRPFVAFTSVPI